MRPRPAMVPRARRDRRGMSLMELIVAVALALGLMAVLIPSVAGYMQLRQRQAAKDLVLLYNQLHDEAVLRNATFRVVFDLERNRYRVEVGESRAIIYSSPEQRERYEQEVANRIAAMNDQELAEYRQRNRPFEKLQSHFATDFELPSNVQLYGVYTPQYGRMMTVDDVMDERRKRKGDEAGLEVYSYVFANGFSERTLVWFVDPKSPDQGFTVEVEPLSGRIHLHGELVDWRDTLDLVPSSGPRIPS